MDSSRRGQNQDGEVEVECSVVNMLRFRHKDCLKIHFALETADQKKEYIPFTNG